MYFNRESDAGSPEYYFENVNCDRCWHCIELYGCFNDRICWSWVIKEA